MKRISKKDDSRQNERKLRSDAEKSAVAKFNALSWT
jgi:hypothetical protein